MNILTFKNVTLYWILSHVLDQYNGFVTLKDFELPDDGASRHKVHHVHVLLPTTPGLIVRTLKLWF